MMWYGMDGGIGMVLWWIVLVLGIVFLVRALDLGRLFGPGGRPDRDAEAAPGKDRALEILRERFARGEIDQEEFEQRRRGLA